MYRGEGQGRKKFKIQPFSDINGNLRVVIGTVAFGMDVDSPVMRLVVHWVPLSDIESYTV